VGVPGSLAKTASSSLPSALGWVLSIYFQFPVSLSSPKGLPISHLYLSLNESPVTPFPEVLAASVVVWCLRQQGREVISQRRGIRHLSYPAMRWPAAESTFLAPYQPCPMFSCPHMVQPLPIPKWAEWKSGEGGTPASAGDQNHAVCGACLLFFTAQPPTRAWSHLHCTRQKWRLTGGRLPWTKVTQMVKDGAGFKPMVLTPSPMYYSVVSSTGSVEGDEGLI
jgi:hypothetical protein